MKSIRLNPQDEEFDIPEPVEQKLMMLIQALDLVSKQADDDDEVAPTSGVLFTSPLYNDRGGLDYQLGIHMIQDVDLDGVPSGKIVHLATINDDPIDLEAATKILLDFAARLDTQERFSAWKQE